MKYFIFMSLFFGFISLGFAAIGEMIAAIICILGGVMAIGIDEILKELRKK